MTKHSEKGGGAFHGMEFRDLPLELRSGRDLKTLQKHSFGDAALWSRLLHKVQKTCLIHARSDISSQMGGRMHSKHGVRNSFSQGNFLSPGFSTHVLWFRKAALLHEVKHTLKYNKVAI